MSQLHHYPINRRVFDNINIGFLKQIIGNYKYALYGMRISKILCVIISISITSIHHCVIDSISIVISHTYYPTRLVELGKTRKCLIYYFIFLYIKLLLSKLWSIDMVTIFDDFFSFLFLIIYCIVLVTLKKSTFHSNIFREINLL